MKLIRLKETDDDEVHVTWALTEEQFQVLLHFAVCHLISKGLIESVDMSKEEFEALEASMDNETFSMFSSDTDPEGGVKH